MVWKYHVINWSSAACTLFIGGIFCNEIEKIEDVNKSVNDSHFSSSSKHQIYVVTINYILIEQGFSTIQNKLEHELM